MPKLVKRQSGLIDNGQISWFLAQVNGAGTLNFWWKASCEADPLHEYDHLVFIVDTDEIVRLDGITDWIPVSVTLGAGMHTLYWAYEKDECNAEGEDCGWVDGIVWAPSVMPTIEGDLDATLTGDTESGFVIKPSAGNTMVDVTIPQGIDVTKVMVEVSPKVATVKPNGAMVKVAVGDNDITDYLVIPESEGVMNIAAATVKDEIVKETLDPSKGAVIKLNAANPQLITAPTRKGLFYQLREGVTLGGMKDGNSTIGDGKPWSPEITVKGGNSAFYSIGVGKDE